MASRSVHQPVTRTHARLSWLALLPGCVPAVSPGEAPREQADVAPRPVAAVVADVAGPDIDGPDVDGPLEVELDGAPLRAAVEALVSMPGRSDAPAHAERAAWTSDSRTFVHCRAVPGLDCTACRFVDRDGTTRSLESGPACGEVAVPRADLEARISAASLAPSPMRWSAGADVVLVLETREHEETNAGQPRPMLKLGARRRTGGPPAWLLHVDPCQGCGTDQICAAAAHVDALALSPDGEQLAVLIHQRNTQGDDSLRVELLATPRVAAAARAPASHAWSP